MPVADVGFKIAARVSGRQLAVVGGVRCDAWSPAVSEVQTTERLADRVFHARRGPHRFLVYMEAYTYWKSSAPWSVLSKSGLLSERDRVPTMSLVFILRPRGYRPQGGHFRLGVEEESTQLVWFREICLWQQQPEPWWDESPGLMALSPLCRQQRPPQEVVTHAAQAITARTPDAIQRADLLTTLAIFGKMAYQGIDVAALIGRDQMKESAIIQEFQQEARQEAGLEKAREYILRVLKAKFGARVRAEFAPQLNSMTDSDRLDRLLELAATSADLKQFRDRFQKI